MVSPLIAAERMGFKQISLVAGFRKDRISFRTATTFPHFKTRIVRIRAFDDFSGRITVVHYHYSVMAKVGSGITATPAAH